MLLVITDQIHATTKLKREMYARMKSEMRIRFAMDQWVADACVECSI